MRDTIVSRARIAAAVGCIAAGALIVAGCGGGGSSTTGASGASGASGAALSKEEFVSQANSICADANQQVEALTALPQNAQLTDAVDLLTQGLALSREFEAKLEALTPPAELQDQVDQLVADSQKTMALAEKSIAAAKANDAQQFQAIRAQIDAIDNKDDQISKSIGLTECAKHVEPQG